MSSLMVELASAYRTGLLRDLGPLIDCTINDIAGGAPFTVVLSGQMVPYLLERRVVRLTDEGQNVVEGRILYTSHNHSNNQVTVTCAPPHIDLVDAGFVRLIVGEHVVYSIGGSYTPQLWWDTFVAPWLVHDQLTWLDLAPVPALYATTYKTLVFTERTSYKMFFDALAAAYGAEWDLIYNSVSNKYEFTLAPAIGIEAPTIPVVYPDTLLDQEDERDSDELFTVIVPRGGTSESTEAADPAENAFVASARSGTGPYRVSLLDPDSGRALVIEDGQFSTATGHALRLPTMQVVAITNSWASDSSVEIASLVNVGEHVQLLANVDGLLLDELSLPSKLLQYGRKVNDKDFGDQRGERNYVPNPGFASLTDRWRLLNSAQLLPYRRDETGDVSGLMNGSRSSGGALSLAMDGFPPSMTLRKGMSIDSQGFSFVTSAAYVSSRLGKIDANIVGTLPATILDGSYLASNTAFGVVADGTIGSGASHVPMKNFPTTAHPNSTDKLLITTGAVYGASVVEFFQHEDPPVPGPTGTALTLGTDFGIDIPAGTTLHYSDNATSFDAVTLNDYLTGFDSTINVDVYPWTGTVTFPIPPGPVVNGRLTWDTRVTTTKTISSNADWGLDLKCTVTLTTSIGRAIALTDVASVEIVASTGAVRVTQLVLLASLFSSDTTVGLHNPSSVALTLVPSGTTFSLPGETFVVATTTTLNGSGAGTVPSTAAPTVSIADNAVMIVRRCLEYSDSDGGSINMMRLVCVAFNTPPQTVDMAAATEGVRVYVRAGTTRVARAHLAYTVWSRSADQTARVQLSLWDSDTNTCLVSVLPDTDPLPLAQAAGVTLPIHGRLRCETILTQSTKLEVRVNTDATVGIGSAAYKVEVTLRWAMITTDASVEVPYVNGSFANPMILDSYDNLKLVANSITRHSITLLQFRRIINQPEFALSAIRRGGTCTFEATGEVVRIVSVQRRPLYPEYSSLVLGTLPPNLSRTLAAVSA